MVWLDYQPPFEKFPAECGCAWVEYEVRQDEEVKLENDQTEVFNQKQAQATWIARDCRILTRPAFPHLAEASL